MVHMASSRLIYGDIAGVMTEDISQVGLDKYLRGKNPRWTTCIFQTIDWDSIGSCMSKMSPQRVINALKIVYGWQNDGQEKDFFLYK